MATTPPIIQAKITSEPVKLPVVPLLIAVVLGIVVAVSVVGGALYYLLRSGKLPVQAASASASQPVATVKTHPVALEPLLVNLADSSGSAYLRLALTLQIAEPSGATQEKEGEPKGGGSKGSDAAVRDTALMVLGRQTSDALLAADGKEHLKKELKAAMAERNPEMRISDLFFTEFLVQR
jgi:flagellar FliL protein